MAIYFKRRFLRFYLGLRNWIENIETLAFACLSRVATGIKVMPHHVRKGAYDPIGQPMKLHVTGKNASNDVLTLAQDLFDESRSRITTMMSKVGTLLTVTSIAVSGTLTSLSLIGLPSHPVFYVAYLFTVIVFLCTGWFLFKFIGVGRISSPNIDQVFLDLSSGEKKAALVRDLLTSIGQNDLRNNFLVDVYKAGRRLCALSFACALALLTLAVMSRIGKEDRLILKLRSDPQLIELLRGPKGERGGQGAQGILGQVGPQGEKGAAYFLPLEKGLFDATDTSFSLDLLRLSPKESAAPTPVPPSVQEPTEAKK